MTEIRIIEQDVTLKIAAYNPVGVMNEGDLDPASQSSGSATVGQAPLADGATGIAWGDVVLPTRQIIDGTGISGGGDLSADRTLSVNQGALDPSSMTSGGAADGYVATADGLGGIAWEAATSDISGPGSSTDHALARWDSTGGDTLLNSGITVSDADAMVFPTTGSISKPSTAADTEAFGVGASAAGIQSTAVGRNATTNSSYYSVVVGHGASITTGFGHGTALGHGASVTDWYGTIVGSGTTGGHGSAVLGFSCEAGTNAICIGRESYARGSGSFAMGYKTYVHTPTSGDNTGAMALGVEAVIGSASGAGADAAIAVGYQATVGYASANSMAIGWSASVGIGCLYGVAIGPNATLTADGDYSIGLGYDVTVSGQHAFAAGRDATVSHDYGMAFGRAAVSTAANRATFGTIGGSYDIALQCGNGIGVWGVAPPASQPTKISDPTDLGSCVTAITAIIDVLEGAGLSAAA